LGWHAMLDGQYFSRCRFVNHDNPHLAAGRGGDGWARADGIDCTFLFQIVLSDGL
jgi:hypothetical protein